MARVAFGGVTSTVAKQPTHDTVYAQTRTPLGTHRHTDSCSAPQSRGHVTGPSHNCSDDSTGALLPLVCLTAGATYGVTGRMPPDRHTHTHTFGKLEFDLSVCLSQVNLAVSAGSVTLEFDIDIGDDVAQATILSSTVGAAFGTSASASQAIGAPVVTAPTVTISIEDAFIGTPRAPPHPPLPPTAPSRAAGGDSSVALIAAGGAGCLVLAAVGLLLLRCRGSSAKVGATVGVAPVMVQVKPTGSSRREPEL